MKGKPTYEQVSQYLKTALIILLAVIEIVVCAQSFAKGASRTSLIVLIVFCVLLTAVEAVNEFVIKPFVWKMVFFGIESAFLLTICLLTGNSFLSTMYCIVLTGCYMSVESFRDKTIIFGVSCGLYSVSFIIGWVVQNGGASLVNSIVDIMTGVFFGILVIAIDFVVVVFILKFYHTNKELSQALKEADESRAQLKSVYEQLMKTEVYEERNRIAKDIHDNAGHSMTTVIMQTEAAKLLIDENPEEAKNRIISANIQARNALDQMRESVHLLAGREQSRALREELETVIAQTFDGTDIKVRYDLCDADLQAEACRYLSNSLKELLANGIRHGKATAFYIELKENGGNLELLVSDNGSGVDGKIVEGFGLKGMRERAEALGGSCNFLSEKEEGFETRITLPIKGDKANDKSNAC